MGRSQASDFKVIDSVSLQVDRGEAVAILGENGAGKSTLLKVVAGVLQPTSGSVELNGRVGALLELGAGFHQELSGRRNALDALRLAGADPAAYEQVAAFCELGSALREPLKTYSSGMVVRLGFAVLSVTDPDLLLSDEVLAVGDESFQKKCVQWVQQYLANGGALLLVSHSLYHVQKLCRRAIWLHEGRIHREGDPFEVTQAYLAYHQALLAAAADELGSYNQQVVIDRAEVSFEQLEGRSRVTLAGEAGSGADQIRWALTQLDGFGDYRWFLPLPR